MCTNLLVLNFDIINLFVYYEGESKKLGNNIESYLAENFKNMGYFYDACRGDLAICADIF